MGKKKFLEKKKSAIFTLVYRDTANQDEDATNPLRQFIRVDQGESYVPGFSEDGPQSLSDDLGFVVEAEDDDSRFADADEGEDEDDDQDEDQYEVDSTTHESQSSKSGSRRTVTDSRRVPDNARLELLELGFPDDGYDYRQHMRTISSVSAFVSSNQAPDPLRADVRAYDASKVGVQSAQDTTEEAEEAVIGSISSASLPIERSLSKGGLIDAEIIAALESSDGSQFDSADELEDQFLVLASEGPDLGDGISDRNVASTSKSRPTGPASEAQLQRPFIDEDDVEEEEEDFPDVPVCEARERPSRLLDEQFEALALNEYDESDFEEVDDDDPLARGHADLSQFNSVLSDFSNDLELHSERYISIADSRKSSQYADFQSHHGDANGGKGEHANMVVNREAGDTVAKKTLELAMDDRDDGQVMGIEESEDDSDEWDCETVLSTVSNLDHHPAKIGAPGKPQGVTKLSTGEKTKMIRLGGKQHLPLDYLPVSKRGDSKQAHNSATAAANPVAKGGWSRAGETPEEKKERKAAVKAGRKEARQTKKSMKVKYKDEAQQAQHGAASMGPSAIHLL